MKAITRTPLPLAAMLLLLALPASGGNWSNLGGNAHRNGMANVAGPTAAELIWSEAADYSIISWTPFIWEGMAFTVRQAGFPQNGGAANDAIVAYDLDTGQELWRHTLAFGGNTSEQWIAWICGVDDGRVYASRSAADRIQPITALDAFDGSVLWTSQASTRASGYDGVVFAGNGDLIVGDFQFVYRIRAVDGSSEWTTPRSCQVSGSCGGAVAVGRSGIYVDEAGFNATLLTKLDPSTGTPLYSSPPMPGMTNQNTPFLSPDGQIIYFARSQNNPAVDVLYAFTDTGSGFTELWNRPIRWTTGHGHGIAPDGSIFTFLADNEFVRLDPSTGNVIASAGVLEPIGTGNLSPQTAVDFNGRVYVSNGWASNPATDGRLWAFDMDLTENLFTLVLDRQNNGGPALGGDGVLVVCDRSAVRAYRTESSGSAPVADAQIVLASLDQNRPNPFHPSTMIRFNLHADVRASLDIFDIRGGHVRRLMENAHGPGGFAVDWDGLDARGKEAPAGVYIYRLSADGTLLTRKMALIR